MKRSELRQLIREEVQRLNESWKVELLNSYFAGDISVDELMKKAKDAGTEVATKKELNDLLKNRFMQDMMADTHDIPVSTIVKKTKELLKFVK